MPLKQRPDGIWWYRIYADGTRTGRRVMVTLPAGTTAAEAKRIYKKELAKAAARQGRPGLRNLTVEDAFDEYLKDVAPSVTESSLAAYRNSFSHLSEAFGSRKIEALRPSDISAYKTRRLAAGAAARSVNHDLTRLRSVVTKMVAWQWLERDPLPKGTIDPLPVDSDKTSWFTAEEWAAFIGVLDHEDTPGPIWARRRSAAAYYRVLLYTGCRRMEPSALRWKHIDLQGRRISIPQEKTGEEKTLQISKALEAVIRSLPRGTPDAFLLTMPDGKPWTINAVVDAFDFAASEVDLRDDLTCHSIRHTFASWLAMIGIPILTISRLLGHSSITMTQRYAHLSPGTLNDAVEWIEAVEKSGVESIRRHLASRTAPSELTRTLESLTC